MMYLWKGKNDGEKGKEETNQKQESGQQGHRKRMDSKQSRLKGILKGEKTESTGKEHSKNWQRKTAMF